jgi:hypothetical protein
MSEPKLRFRRPRTSLEPAALGLSMAGLCRVRHEVVCRGAVFFSSEYFGSFFARQRGAGRAAREGMGRLKRSTILRSDAGERFGAR